jgi:deoxyribodipyrimidine photolyase-related protein
MNHQATVIYPHQLFEDNPALREGNTVFLVEDPLFFNQYSFHKKKLVFHRATLKYYQDYLELKGFNTLYINAVDLQDSGDVASHLKKHKIKKVFVNELDDHWLASRLQKACKSNSIEIETLSSPGFLTPLEWAEDFFASRKDYRQTFFYIAQRKRMKILLKNGKPVGDKWTFDNENRKKLPRDANPPELERIAPNRFVSEASSYIEKNFANNPGSIDGLSYPSTHSEAEEWLDEFIDSRLRLFGDYQDAISRDSSFLYHSILSAPLNVGLLTPKKIIDKVLAEHSRKPIPLNSLEGFVRQVIGWREYFRVIYKRESVRQRTTNFFNFDRKIPESFWTGETGILPVDDSIDRVLENAYGHHIERLMVLGNIMLLCEFDPNEVYRWFMELFIDSYDWVMVPNVYGMSQFADGGLITTKPYISSSNYIRNMSDYEDDAWCQTWDGLYWSFIDKHKELLKENARMGLMISQLEKMSPSKLSAHKKNALTFLQTLDNSP